jgi:DNA-binding response OmpR family regulator
MNSAALWGWRPRGAPDPRFSPDMALATGHGQLCSQGPSMGEGFTILVADRNRHVGDLLQRELQAEGYRVQVARDDREVLKLLAATPSPQLLILDLEIPYDGGLAILEQLRRSYPSMPVVIHTLLTEHESHPDVAAAAAFVEKGGDTERLKVVVREVLNKHYQRRLAGSEIPQDQCQNAPEEL